MKKIQKFVMAFLFGAMTIGFTACSSDNGETYDLPEVGQATTSVSTSDKEMQKVTKNYVQNVIYPTYQALAANARTLYGAAQALYQAAEAGTRLTLLAKPSRTHVASGSVARLSSSVRPSATSLTRISTHGLSTVTSLRRPSKTRLLSLASRARTLPSLFLSTTPSSNRFLVSTVWSSFSSAMALTVQPKPSRPTTPTKALHL